jgi:hypothetical protein
VTISQPVGRRRRRIGDRVRAPDVVDVIETERGVLAEVGGLVIDLEWVLVVELIMSSSSATLP